MRLPPQSVRKLFRDFFRDGDPIRFDPAKRSAARAHWNQRLGRIEGVKITHHPGDKDERSRVLCRFTIPEPNSVDHYWRSDEVRIEHDSNDQIVITTGHRGNSELVRPLARASQVDDFVAEVLRRYAVRHAKGKKRQKVRDFKARAILAQVRKLAAEEKFEFAASHDAVKLTLFVRLAPQRSIQIQIPFKRFDEALPKLRTAIESLRELHDQGLSVKIVGSTRLPRGVKWNQAEDAGSL